MEVGAVKQAFNNEVILLKKNLNQAKLHVIHKLTRKAKTLNEKKAPDHLKEKLKRKAESAVSEVLIIKKIKARDVAKFIITHQGQVTEYLNKPKADNDKACARLVLHKSLQGKYKFIRNRFGNIPIKDLFMSRHERRKLKKEAKEQHKNKKKNKEGKVTNSAGDWKVEDIRIGDVSEEEIRSHDKISSDENDQVKEEKITRFVNDTDSDQSSSDNGIEETSKSDEETEQSDKHRNEHTKSNDISENKSEDDEVGKLIKLQQANNVKPVHKHSFILKNSNELISTAVDFGRPNKEMKGNKTEKKVKENRNRNLKEKLQNRKFKKDELNAHTEEKKVVDPFFITATGENYLTLAEPRQPDEIKEVHKQGNRQERRAAMFGRKFKPRNDFRNKFDVGYDSKNSGGRSKNGKLSNAEDKDRKTKFNDNDSKFNGRNNKFNERKFNGKFNSNILNNNMEQKEEKLHPSWEAKRKLKCMSLLPSQGKKIVFNDG